VNRTPAPQRPPRSGAGARPDGPRIGSLCSGYGGLDMAVQAVFGGTVAWHAQYDPDDKYQYAAQILDLHWPDIPNHGDITAIDWGQAEPVDILTAGFPCQDVSLAGLRAGIADGTRSGLWLHVARAIKALRPRLVVIENVRGLLSQKADRGLGADAPDMDPATGARLVLRALGAVLGDLADLGFDAEWAVVQAAEVGAPHQRERVFLLAWPAAADPESDGRNEGRTEPEGQQGGSDAAVGGGADIHWGDYEPAIRRWEHAIGRPAPRPTDDRGRLNPPFVEWLMGLPAGHVTDTPGLPRSAQLKALGNGVVPQQATAAIRLLADRAGLEVSV